MQEIALSRRCRALAASRAAERHLELLSTGDAQLGVHMLQVVLDDAYRQEQAISDVLASHTRRGQLGHFPPPSGELLRFAGKGQTRGADVAHPSFNASVFRSHALVLRCKPSRRHAADASQLASAAKSNPPRPSKRPATSSSPARDLYAAARGQRKGSPTARLRPQTVGRGAGRPGRG